MKKVQMKKMQMKKTLILLAMMTVLASASTYASGTKPPPDPKRSFAPWVELFKTWF